MTVHNSSHPEKSQADLNRMSVKGLKAVMNILDKWGCSPEQAQAILDCQKHLLPIPQQPR